VTKHTEVDITDKVMIKKLLNTFGKYSVRIPLKVLLLVCVSQKKEYGGRNVYMVIRYNILISYSSRRAYISRLFAQFMLLFSLKQHI
jgi:hypothetical protein